MRVLVLESDCLCSMTLGKLYIPPYAPMSSHDKWGLNFPPWCIKIYAKYLTQCLPHGKCLLNS